jgi:hypothetical protein
MNEGNTNSRRKSQISEEIRRTKALKKKIRPKTPKTTTKNNNKHFVFQYDVKGQVIKTHTFDTHKEALAKEKALKKRFGYVAHVISPNIEDAYGTGFEMIKPKVKGDLIDSFKMMYEDQLTTERGAKENIGDFRKRKEEKAHQARDWADALKEQHGITEKQITDWQAEIIRRNKGLKEKPYEEKKSPLEYTREDWENKLKGVKTFEEFTKINKEFNKAYGWSHQLNVSDEREIIKKLKEKNVQFREELAGKKKPLELTPGEWNTKIVQANKWEDLQNVKRDFNKAKGWSHQLNVGDEKRIDKLINDKFNKFKSSMAGIPTKKEKPVDVPFKEVPHKGKKKVYTSVAEAAKAGKAFEKHVSSEKKWKATMKYDGVDQNFVRAFSTKEEARAYAKKEGYKLSHIFERKGSVAIYGERKKTVQKAALETLRNKPSQKTKTKKPSKEEEAKKKKAAFEKEFITPEVKKRAAISTKLDAFSSRNAKLDYLAKEYGSKVKIDYTASYGWRPSGEVISVMKDKTGVFYTLGVKNKEKFRNFTNVLNNLHKEYDYPESWDIRVNVGKIRDVYSYES